MSCSAELSMEQVLQPLGQDSSGLIVFALIDI